MNASTMTSESAPPPIPSISTDLDQMKKTFDLRNPRRQMSLGLVGMLALCFATYWRATSAGSVPTSELHALLLFATSAMLSLIVFELTGRFGNRLGAGPAIWAGLLFTVCPWSSALLLGRTFYLVAPLLQLCAIFCFARFQLLRERSYYIAAILAALLANLTGSDWATPYILTALAFLLPSSGQSATVKKVLLLLPFWAIDVAAVLRTVAVASSDLKALSYVAPGPFVLLFHPQGCYQSICSYISDIGKSEPIIACTIAGVLVGLRITFRTLSVRVGTFLCLWGLSSGTFFATLLAAPACASIVLFALPAIDSTDKRFFVAHSVIGSLLLLTLLVFWAMTGRYPSHF